MIEAGHPLFHLQIVHVEDGVVANIPGGGALEAELVALITRHVLSLGVRFRTQKRVERAVREGVSAALMSLKEQTRFIA